MKRAVELAVAAVVEAVALDAAGAGGDWGGAGMARELRVRGGAVGVGGVPDEDRGADRSASGLCEQLRAVIGDEDGELLFQVTFLTGERNDPGELGFRDPHRDTGPQARETPRDLSLPVGLIEAPETGQKGGIDPDQPPAQLVDLPGAFADELLAVIAEHPNISRVLIDRGRRERVDPVSDGGARDRQRVDRIRLPRLTLPAAEVSSPVSESPSEKLMLTPAPIAVASPA